MRALEKLRDRANHRDPLTKYIGEDLYELGKLGKLNTRVLRFFRHPQRIVAVHAIRNKAQSIRASDFAVAKDRMKDWIERNPD